MLLLPLLACAPPTPLARIPGATRLAELANGQLLVGTEAGELWTVTSFGDTRRLGMIGPGPVRDLVADPLGTWLALTGEGGVTAGGLWSAPRHVGEGAALLLRNCEQTRWLAEPGAGVSALALGSACDTLLEGTADGRVGGRSVGSAPITRVQTVGSGVLWVAVDGRAGCAGCDAVLPGQGVVDAVAMHLAPFLPGEVVWVDEEGALWTSGG